MACQVCQDDQIWNEFIKIGISITAPKFFQNFIAKAYMRVVIKAPHTFSLPLYRNFPTSPRENSKGYYFRARLI